MKKLLSIALLFIGLNLKAQEVSLSHTNITMSVSVQSALFAHILKDSSITNIGSANVKRVYCRGGSLVINGNYKRITSSQKASLFFDVSKDANVTGFDTTNIIGFVCLNHQLHIDYRK